MPNQLTPKDEFLLKEYESAHRLTYHIDDLRNKLTSFFLTFTAIVTTTLTIIFKEENKIVSETNPQIVLGSLMLFLALIGTIIITILARLRKGQIEHFKIINNVRIHFLELDYELWNIVQLSEQTLPKPNMKSGSYFWVLIIMVVTSFLLSFSLNILFDFIKLPFFWFLFILILGGENILYLKLAKPPESIIYSKNNKPYKS